MEMPKAAIRHSGETCYSGEPTDPAQERQIQAHPLPSGGRVSSSAALNTMLRHQQDSPTFPVDAEAHSLTPLQMGQLSSPGGQLQAVSRISIVSIGFPQFPALDLAALAIGESIS